MSDFKGYRENYDRDEKFFRSQISDRESKAFEYGILVVRTSVLISGGALVAIPTVIGISTELVIDLQRAADAALWFAISLLTALLGAYIIHVNWMLHLAAWEKHWEERQKFLVAFHLDKRDPGEIPGSGEHFAKSIKVTFVIPHLLVLVYLSAISLGFFNVYFALGVSD